MLKSNVMFSNLLGLVCITVIIAPSESLFGSEYGDMFGESEVSRTDILELEVQQLKATIGTLMEAVTILTEELGALKDSRDYEKKNSEHVYPSSGYKRTSGPLQKRMFMDFIRDERDYYGLPNEVGFHSYLSKQANLIKKQTIVFDRMITNIGSAYNPKSGEFVCPRAGTYTFSLTVSTNTDGYLEATITKNGAPVLTAISDSRHNRTYNQGGGTVILKLKERDVVKVVMQWPDKSVVRGKLYSTFTGYMLKAD